LDNIKKILVDSNIFIFANIEEYPEYPLVKAKIKELIKTHYLLVNTIIISEVQYKLYRLLGQEESHNRTLKILNSKYIVYESVSIDTILKALELSYNSNIRINDAIIAQNAMDLNVDVFTDNTEDFKKISNLKIIPFR